MQGNRSLRAAAVAAAAIAALAGAADASARGRVRPAPDVAVARVSAPRTVVAGAPFELAVTLAERSRRAPATAVVSVAGGAAVRVPLRAGGTARAVLPVTIRTGGTVALAVSAKVARDSSTANNTLTATVTATDFALSPANVVLDGFAGFGAQFNQHVYAGLSRDAGVSDDNVGDMEAKVTALGPHLVRLFFTRLAFGDPDRMQSFVRTAQLAQRTGATIDVTWQTSFGSNPEVEMPQFADVIADLVLNRGVTNLRWVTVQNEVNSTRITMDAYAHMVRLVDARLQQDGVRDRVRFMGGDLVAATSALGNTQADWLSFMATRMSDVLDAYAIHVYWDYWSPGKIVNRLKDVRAIVDALPPAERKPVYVTEFGVRGHRTPGDGGPGTWDDGTPLESTNVGGFQQAWLDVLATKLGYAGTIKWDAYFGRYDATPQSYTMIGPPQDGWPLRPVYHLTRLFTSTTRPGWRVLAVDGSAGTKLVTAFGGLAGELTIAGLDTSGAALNTASVTTVSYAIGGLPPNARFSLVVWNADGAGTLTPAAPVTADAAGVATVTAPLQSVWALTTLPL